MFYVFCKECKNPLHAEVFSIFKKLFLILLPIPFRRKKVNGISIGPLSSKLNINNDSVLKQ